MLNRNDKKEIAGKLKALFPKASDSGREQLLNLLVNCCCIDLCSLNNNADDIQFTGLTLSGNTLLLTLTINGTPTTQVVNLPTQISTTLVNNGDGTFTYTNESNVVTTIDVATLLVDAGISDGFVNNNDGTLTHAAIDGTVVTFDINDLLLTTTPLFTVNAGTTSVSTDASLGSQVITYGDILHFWSNGSLNFNVQAGSVVVGIDTEAGIIPYTPTTLVSTNVGDALDELAANSHNPTTLTNTAAPFSWNVSTQAGNIPVSPTLVNNGNGTITFTSGTGTAPVIIDVTENASEVLTTTPITINGTTYPANTTVETILSAISTYTGTTNLTYTPSATNGTIVSDTGSDATIPQATITDAGLLIPADKIKLNNLSGVNTGDQTSIVGITGTKAQFNTAVTDGDFLYVGDITQYTDELAQDAIGAMIDTSLVYVDGTPLLTRAALIGDITATQGSNSTLIANNVVTNAKLAQASSFTLKGNNTGATANVTDLSIADVKTLLAYTGADVANTPAGNIAATTVQAAINELDGEKQVNLQFQEEGVNLGTSGTVDTVNFTGAAVTSSRVGNTLTVDIPATIGVTNLSYTPSATNGIVVSDTGTDATITSVTGVNAGLATPAMLTNSHVPATFNDSGTIDFTVSGTDNQTVTATLLGVSGATIGQVPQSDGAGNITWVTPTSATNLTYTASPTQGTVLSDTGTDAIIPTVTATNAGLATPDMLADSHVPVTIVNSSVTITQSGTDNQTLTADISGIDTATVGQVPSTDGAGNIVWVAQTPIQNIYNTDGTLTGNRTVDQNGNSLIINTAYAGSGLETHIEQSNNIAGIGGEGVGFWTENTDGYLSALYASDGIAVNSSQNAANTQFSRTLNMSGIGYQFAGMSVSDGTVQNDFNVNTTDITVSQYPNTRDDSGTTPPTNFLYTDTAGTFLSAPLTEALKNEWHTTGNAGTDGGTTNFLGTTDAQDLVFKTNGLTIAQFSDNASQPSTGSIVFGSDDATYGTVSTASGSNTIAMGINNVVTGDLCFVGGLNNTVSNNGNTCFGAGNIVSGLANSLCVGIDNIVSGDLATSLGAGNTIGATGGFACGNGGVLDNTASYGCVFNTENTAKGLFSAAFGISNTTYSVAEIVFGGFNTAYTPIGSTNIWQPADRLFTIGNGTSGAARNNALTMWKDGRSMWNGDVAKQNTWIGVNGTNPQNFINVTTPTGALAAISTEHTTSGNYAVLGSNAGNSGLAINNTRQFAFTTTAGTTSTQLGATTTVGNYSSTGFLFGGGGVATSTVDVNGSFATNILSDNTAALTLTNIHRTIINTGAATTYTLPVASTCRGREYVIANHGTGDITFATAITVANGVTITTLSNVAGTNNITIQSDGTTWVKTSN